jgi:hypothetical protein
VSRPAGEEPGGLALLEEAADLLRGAPAHAFLVYVLGTVPFLLALLEFLGEMSRSGLARKALPQRALLLTLLYVAMKTAHAFLCRALLAARRGAGEGARVPVLRVALEQAALQTSSLFLLPIAALVTVPYGYLVAFYQGATAVGALPREKTRALAAEASAQAVLWPKQSHVLVGVLLLLRAMALLNAFALLVVAPYLLKTLLGVETVFSRSGASVLNTTTLAVALVLAHLMVDPLAKAPYTLRSFYGLSVASGEDLKSALTRIAKAAAVLLVLLPALAKAAPVALSAPARPAVAPAELSRSLDVVLARPEYRWRAPSDEREESGFLLDLARAVDGAARRAVAAVARAAREIADWLGKLLRPRGSARSGEETHLPAPPKSLVFALLLLSALAGLLLLRRRGARQTPTLALPSPLPAVDVLDESVTADSCPADSWLVLARELLETGDSRRALRALTLSALAQLSAKGFLVLAAHKSNGEYVRELARRSAPRLLAPFGEVIAAFDGCWYGSREATRELLARTLANVEAIRAA